MNVYVDGEYALSLFADTILQFKLNISDSITQEKIEELRKFDEYIFAKKLAYDFLSYRNRSTSEIKKKLVSKKISDRTIDEVVKHLEEIKLLDDAKFAKEFLQAKVNKKAYGRRVIQQKLVQKGVDRKVAEALIQDEMNEDEQLQTAGDILKKYLSKNKSLEKIKLKQKAYALLLRRGFDYEVINAVISKNLHE